MCLNILFTVRNIKGYMDTKKFKAFCNSYEKLVVKLITRKNHERLARFGSNWEYSGRFYLLVGTFAGPYLTEISYEYN